MSSQTLETTVTKTNTDTCSSLKYDNDVGMYFLIFFVILTIIWIILFSFNPYFVQKTVETPDGEQQNVERANNTTYTFWVSFIIALIIIIIMAIAKSCR